MMVPESRLCKGFEIRESHARVVGCMVEKVEMLLLLLGAVGLLAVVADRLRLPFPILLVFAGLLIGFIPQVPDIRLDPELVFVVFLPPLLFSAAWNFPWEDFRANLVPIFALAVGLVFATMIGVGYVAHWLIPGMTLATGFVLGAIVSPPDAVAANAVLKNLRIPKSLSSILEGESLVNDSSGLVAYQFAVAAVVTGSFSFAQAGGDFLWASFGGILFGWLVGMVLMVIHRGLRDPAVEITLTILTPYLAYLPAEWLGCSGVLAVVTTGIHLGHRSWEILTPESRLQRTSIWKFIDYLLNGLVFILIGVQFPAIIDGVKAVPVPQLLVIGLVISLVVVVIRFLWILPMGAVRKYFLASLIGPPALERKVSVVASWAGMRGVVSLAAALALPEFVASGEEFPHRHVILFIVFAVIFFTLVVQGLTLPALVRRLGVEEPEEEYEGELRARMELIESIIHEIDQISAGDISPGKRAAMDLWRDHYQNRVEHMRQRIDVPMLAGENTLGYEMGIFTILLQHVREHLTEMRREGRISEETRKRIEYDFDLEERRVMNLLTHSTVKRKAE